MKAVCSRHEMAYEVGAGCTYCSGLAAEAAARATAQKPVAWSVTGRLAGDARAPVKAGDARPYLNLHPWTRPSAGTNHVADGSKLTAYTDGYRRADSAEGVAMTSNTDRHLWTRRCGCGATFALMSLLSTERRCLGCIERERGAVMEARKGELSTWLARKLGYVGGMDLGGMDPGAMGPPSMVAAYNEMDVGAVEWPLANHWVCAGPYRLSAWPAEGPYGTWLWGLQAIGTGELLASGGNRIGMAVAREACIAAMRKHAKERS